MCENNTATALHTILQTINETTYLRIFETKTKCSSNNGTIARSFPEEKQYDDVLYNQHNIGNSSILIRFRPNVQNGTPLSTPPRAQANSSRSAKPPVLEDNL